HRLVRLEFQGTDVIHSWWVPAVSGKTDAVPGYDNFSWLKIDEVGKWRGECAELCGVGHSTMQIIVQSMDEPQYNAWVQQQMAAAPETYNQMTSAPGVTMIFFFASIFLTGIANYMVPIMIGARDMAFPRVNLLGFWLVPVSIILYYSGFFSGGALDAGWTGYAPLTEKAYQAKSLGVDFWAMSIIVWAISGIMASTNFLTTIVALRAPGMKLTRLPL